MSTTNDNKRQQLVSKLREMFQMDQADLDFDIYRKDYLVQQGVKFREPKEGLDDAKKAFQKLKKSHGDNWKAVLEGWKAFLTDTSSVSHPLHIRSSCPFTALGVSSCVAGCKPRWCDPGQCATVMRPWIGVEADCRT